VVVRRAVHGWLVLLILVLTSVALLPGRVAIASAMVPEAARAGTGMTAAASAYDDSTHHAIVHGGSRVTVAVAADAADRTSPSADGSRVCAASRIATEAELPAGYSSFSAAKTAMGSPGTGNVFDHVVEQSQIGRSGFSPEEIHNPFNMNPVSAGTNQLKANYYSTKQFFTGGGTVRDWMNGQSFSDQYEFGMDVLRRIENGVSLP